MTTIPFTLPELIDHTVSFMDPYGVEFQTLLNGFKGIYKTHSFIQNNPTLKAIILLRDINLVKNPPEEKIETLLKLLTHTISINRPFIYRYFQKNPINKLHRIYIVKNYSTYKKTIEDLFLNAFYQLPKAIHPTYHESIKCKIALCNFLESHETAKSGIKNSDSNLHLIISECEDWFNIKEKIFWISPEREWTEVENKSIKMLKRYRDFKILAFKINSLEKTKIKDAYLEAVASNHLSSFIAHNAYSWIGNSNGKKCLASLSFNKYINYNPLEWHYRKLTLGCHHFRQPCFSNKLKFFFRRNKLPVQKIILQKYSIGLTQNNNVIEISALGKNAIGWAVKIRSIPTAFNPENLV